MTPATHNAIAVNVTGGAWIAAEGHGRLSEGRAFSLTSTCPTPPKSVFAQPPPRYGRMDAYTRLACAGAALALQDAHLPEAAERRPIGIVTASRYDCLQTDLDYYETTREQDGLLASPNLFSYTLPGVALGECAVQFGLTGPTLCLGDDGAHGLDALRTALRFLRGGEAKQMLAGWIESGLESAADRAPDEPPQCGALFVMLEAAPPAAARRITWVADAIQCDGQELRSLRDLF